MANVLLLSIDTMRYDAIRSVGPLWWWREWGLLDAFCTPNLDRFAAECCAFTHCYATSSFTPPSHASMMTGRYVPVHGAKAFFHTLRPGIPTLAGILAERGYVCVAWFENECLDYCGILRDFHETYNYREHTWDQFVARLGELQADHSGKVFAFVHLFDLHSPYMASLRKLGQDGEIEAYFERLHRVLAECGYNVSSRLLGWVSSVVERRHRLTDEPAHYGERVCTNGELLGEWIVGRAGQMSFRARAYAHGLSYFDTELWPAVEQSLRETNLISDDSIAVVTADHGEAPSFVFDTQRFAHKADLVEGCLRVPLLIRCPSSERAPETEQLASLVDILPTVLGLIGISTADLQLDGVDLFTEPDPERAVFADGEHFQQARWDKWGFRRGQERGVSTLWERAVISRGLKLVCRGDHALLEALERQTPPDQVETIYRAVVGRYPTERESRKLLRLIRSGVVTARELAEIALEAVEEQGFGARLIATDDLDETHNLLDDPRYAQERARLTSLLETYAAEARSLEVTKAGYAARDEEAVVSRLRELGYL